jgi:alpha-L-fucosidase
VKTPKQLSNLYFLSVGRGANLLLNVPPNRDGLIDPADAASLKAYGEYLHQTFDKPVALASVRELMKPEIVLDLPPDTSFDIVKIKENIRFGQRVEAVNIEMLESDTWKPVTTATSIGPRRIIRLPEPVSCAKVRLTVTQSAAPPMITEFALFREAQL